MDASERDKAMSYLDLSFGLASEWNPQIWSTGILIIPTAVSSETPDEAGTNGAQNPDAEFFDGQAPVNNSSDYS